MAVIAAASNTGPVWIGAAGVTMADDGTGDGYRLDPSQGAPGIAAGDLSQVYINGAAGNFVYFLGN